MNAYNDYVKEEIKNLPKLVEHVKEKPSDQELKKQAIDTANEYANQIRYCEKNDKKYDQKQEKNNLFPNLSIKKINYKQFIGIGN